VKSIDLLVVNIKLTTVDYFWLHFIIHLY